MARIAVTDGMSDEAVQILENAGHEVVLRHHEPEEIANGSLLGFDAVVIKCHKTSIRTNLSVSER